MNKLREFPDWPVEQVMEVALKLYALRPFKIDNVSRCHLLAREAFDFLDNMHKACTEIARERTATGAAYRRAESRSAEAGQLRDVEPFEKAVLFITREKRTKRALPKLEKLLRHNPRYFGGRFGKAQTSRTLNAQFARWKRTGIPRNEVAELQALFEHS